MTTNHTPGPWAIRDDDEDWVVSIVGSSQIVLARVRTATVEPGDGNARLIAAAPDLLEACKTFAEWLRREEAGFVKAGNKRDTPEGEAAWRDWYNENIRICDLAQTQAHAAISKATGA